MAVGCWCSEPEAQEERMLVVSGDLGEGAVLQGKRTWLSCSPGHVRGRERPFPGVSSSQHQPLPQKAALAQFPELTPAQPELCLPGDQSPVLCPAQPAPEVLPAPSHSHHGEVLCAPQASLDMVSCWGGGSGCSSALCQVLPPSLGLLSVGEDGGGRGSGEKLYQKAGFALYSFGHPGSGTRALGGLQAPVGH